MLKELKPRKALNKAFLKVKPKRAEIESFKTNLIALLDRTNDTESEEFHKNLISDFLKDTYYKQNHFINTKGRYDLVIHNGQSANSSVGVIIEAKKPTNKSEMVTAEKLNTKAFQELVLYYLRERITHKNLEVKHLVATNINEWFIFDATLFERLFAQNKNLVKQFNDFEAGRLADTKTDFFYKQIAEPFIDSITSEIEFTYFDFRNYVKYLKPLEHKDLIPRPLLQKGEGGKAHQDSNNKVKTVETNLPPKLLNYARELRKNLTDAEHLLWALLRNRGLNNLKFRRQHPLAKGFILDFYCAEIKLAIEVDGGYHQSTFQKEYDEGRTYEIEKYGIKVIRFSNEDVLEQTEKVLKTIINYSSSPSPLEEDQGESEASPSPFGEGRGESEASPSPSGESRGEGAVPKGKDDPSDDQNLIALFKLLSPEHLLKLPFTNDSNSLDKRFYSELLHIIGLTETKEGSKKLIERNKAGERNTGTILESAIIQLDSLDKLSRLEKPNQFGNTQQERLFNVALELSITWINRILFLKLLEAQLITYHRFDKLAAGKSNKSYSFLNPEKIRNYDDLNSLFFQVLARKHDERNEDVKKIFEKVPYLNSSLFEPTDIEQVTLFISNLKDDKTIPIFSHTVLKDQQGKKRTGNIPALQYLLEFLDAYDFGAEGGEEIQEDNKTLINASVLGLIFEKINGYKDGSFFTPGFITMYMCRETIRKAVVQKFDHDFPDFGISRIEDIYDLIPQKISRKKANQIVNSLKICDPAVGSGHFLVSALNEIIAVKNDLKILEDKEGKSLHRYEVEVVNDELIVTDEEGELFEYTPGSTGSPANRESQRVQETLFHEKQTIIENCLFGVDINSNSVKICRLRLWIELLKNAYYKDISTLSGAEAYTKLETLPNIDINIKCGNSLVSRFAIDADLKQALKKSKWTIDSYRIAVATYRNAESKEQKREMERMIAGIKSDFRSEISANDPKVKKLRKLSGDLYQMTNQGQLFEMSQKEKAEWNNRVQQLTQEISKWEAEIEEIKSNKIFENAFEWRFEFPEVLNDDGDFVGFDVVIGNPPYVDLKELDNNLVKFIFAHYPTSSNRVNLYSTFAEKAFSLLNSEGYFSFIIPNSILMGSSYQILRNLIKNEIYGIVKLPEKVFEDAAVETVIIEFKKKGKFEICQTLAYKKDDKVTELDETLKYLVPKKSWEIYDEPKFNIYISDEILKPLTKIHGKGKRLEEIADFTLGITPYDKYKGHSKELIENKEFHSDVKLSDEYKPLIKGENIVPYYVDEKENGYIKYGSWLGAPREERFFTEPRVIVRQIVSGRPPKIYAGYTDKPLYFTQIGFSIIPKSDVNVFELTALLNSKLMNFYHKYLFLDIEKELFQKILIENCKLFPCRAFKDSNSVREIIEKIIKTKSSDAEADTTEFETNLDKMIYELYDLTEEEIKIVEGNG